MINLTITKSEYNEMDTDPNNHCRDMHNFFDSDNYNYNDNANCNINNTTFIKIFEAQCAASRFERQTNAFLKRGKGRLKLFYDQNSRMIILLFMECAQHNKIRLPQTFCANSDFNMNDNSNNTFTGADNELVQYNK